MPTISATTPATPAARELALRREVLRLWLTAMLRLTRLTVADEIENGLAYFRLTFLDQLPRLDADLETTLVSEFGVPRDVSLAPFLRGGTWIGGDRDGNPNVTAETLEHASQQQSTLIMLWYLEEVHALGAELPLPTRVVIAMSNGLVSYFPFMVGGAVVLALLVQQVRKVAVRFRVVRPQ